MALAKRGRRWGFDIETAQWDHFMLGFAHCYESGVSVFLDSTRAMIDWYASLPSEDIVVGHNAGHFDMLALIDASLEHKTWKTIGESDALWTGTLAGSTLVSLRAKGMAEIRDSFRLFPMSLAAWTGEKQETGLPCRCGEECGGYCSIRPKMGRKLFKRLAEYCENDSKILVHKYVDGVRRWEEEGYAVRDERGRVRRTIGGMAYATALRMCPGLDPQGMDWAEYDATRAGYYGGRCEVYRIKAPRGHRYDINSAYPWALTQPVPYGKARWRNSRQQSIAAYAKQEPGIYTAVVKVPPTRMPPLPHRCGPRLIWAHGVIEGAWTDIELREAEERGCEVDIRRAITYPKLAPLYAPYMKHVYKRRDLAKRKNDKAWTGFHKLAGNSVSGKLAQGPDADTLRILCSPTAITDALDKCAPHWAPENVSGRIRWIGGDAFVVTHRRVPPSAAPHHAAYLTARVRCEVLLPRMERAGDDLCYVDTDSTYTRKRDDRNVNDRRLGAFKYEGIMRNWHARAPKVYEYQDDDGEWLVKIKGIPLQTKTSKQRARAHETFESLLAGEDVLCDRGVESVRKAFALHGRAFKRRNLTRSLQASESVAGTRWIADDGTTIPLERLADGGYRWPGVSVSVSDHLYLAGLAMDEGRE